MKKIIAKGMASFLIIIIVLFSCSSLLFCYAEEKENPVNIENVTGKEYIKLSLDGYVLNIENQSSKRISHFCVILKVENDTVKIHEVTDLEGFEKGSIDLTKYFSEEYMNGKSLEITLIEDYTKEIIITLVITFVSSIICLYFFRLRHTHHFKPSS